MVVTAAVTLVPISCSMLLIENSRSGSAPIASLRPPRWKCPSSIEFDKLAPLAPVFRRDRLAADHAQEHDEIIIGG